METRPTSSSGIGDDSLRSPRSADRQCKSDPGRHSETSEGVVHVVDADERDRVALVTSLTQTGIAARGYSSAEELLSNWIECGPSCVVTEVRLPGMSGLELQRRLAQRSPHTTFVFLTGHSDVASAVAAIREGAVDFLEKFLVGAVLARRIGTALRESVRRQAGR